MAMRRSLVQTVTPSPKMTGRSVVPAASSGSQTPTFGKKTGPSTAPPRLGPSAFAFASPASTTSASAKPRTLRQSPATANATSPTRLATPSSRGCSPSGHSTPIPCLAPSHSAAPSRAGSPAAPLRRTQSPIRRGSGRGGSATPPAPKSPLAPSAPRGDTLLKSSSEFVPIGAQDTKACRAGNAPKLCGGGYNGRGEVYTKQLRPRTKGTTSSSSLSTASTRSGRSAMATNSSLSNGSCSRDPSRDDFLRCSSVERVQSPSRGEAVSSDEVVERLTRRLLEAELSLQTKDQEMSLLLARLSQLEAAVVGKPVAPNLSQPLPEAVVVSVKLEV